MTWWRFSLDYRTIASKFRSSCYVITYRKCLVHWNTCHIKVSVYELSIAVALCSWQIVASFFYSLVLVSVIYWNAGLKIQIKKINFKNPLLLCIVQHVGVYLSCLLLVRVQVCWWLHWWQPEPQRSASSAAQWSSSAHSAPSPTWSTRAEDQFDRRECECALWLMCVSLTFCSAVRVRLFSLMVMLPRLCSNAATRWACRRETDRLWMYSVVDVHQYHMYEQFPHELLQHWFSEATLPELTGWLMTMNMRSKDVFTGL